MCGFVSGLSIGVIGDVGIRSVGYHAVNITAFSMLPMPAAGVEGANTNNSNRSGDPNEALPLKLAPWGKEHDDKDDAAQSGTISSAGQNKLFVGMMVMLIFSEALALYGLIVALIVSQNSYECS